MEFIEVPSPRHPSNQLCIAFYYRNDSTVIRLRSGSPAGGDVIRLIRSAKNACAKGNKRYRVADTYTG